MKTETVLVVVVVAAGAWYLMAKRAQTAAGAGAPVGASLGLYGAQTHLPISNTNAALISTLGSAVSSWFGGGASSPAAIAPDANTPYLGNGTISNPVYPLPSVLPYSYKQQVIDTPTLLGTDALFTPTVVGGSAGNYADQGSATGSSSDYLNNGF